MPILDFTEIPKAHIATGNQDTFELFARDFFVEVLKFKTLSGPNRGADGGKDILFEEYHSGTLSENKLVWLVSCKHKAHTGLSVSTNDENDISDRVAQFKADGFIGFYSTLCSSGLNNRFDSFREKFGIEIFDKEKIEKYIFKHKSYELLKRYFPVSYKKWYNVESNTEPSKILDNYEPLLCKVCGTDLLKIDRSDGNNHGIIGFVRHPKTHKYIDVYSACVGNCDRKLQAFYRTKKMFTSWDSLSDMLIPTIYLRRYMAMLNNLNKGTSKFEPKAFECYKQILIAISQYVFRQQSDRDIRRAKSLLDLPDGI